MFPDTPTILIGSEVTIWLRQPDGSELNYIVGDFLGMTEQGVWLGADMLHVRGLVPREMVAFINVTKDPVGTTE